MSAATRDGFARAISSRPLTRGDRALLSKLELSLSDGLDLYRWWQATEAGGGPPDKIPLARELRSDDWNYGFLVDAPIRRGVLPVLGVIQDMFYDLPKSPPGMAGVEPAWIGQQLERFVLRHFMRVTSALEFQAVRQRGSNGGSTHHAVKHARRQRRGWGYQQLFYKLRDGGRIRAFAEADRFKITDLLEIGPVYDWIVLRVDILDFNLPLHLGGVNGPVVYQPVKETVYAVLTPDFVVNQERPRAKVLAEYGYGYAFIADPEAPASIFAYGPSGLTSAFETLHFRVLETGEVRAKMAFVANQPTRMLDPITYGFSLADRLSFGAASRVLAPVRSILHDVLPAPDPVFGGIDLLNLASGNYAADRLDISRERLVKNIMTLHFTDAYNMFLGSVKPWKLIPDWLDSANLPRWATEGTLQGADLP